MATLGKANHEEHGANREKTGAGIVRLAGALALTLVITIILPGARLPAPPTASDRRTLSIIHAGSRK